MDKVRQHRAQGWPLSCLELLVERRLRLGTLVLCQLLIPDGLAVVIIPEGSEMNDDDDEGSHKLVPESQREFPFASNSIVIHP